MIKFFRHIRKSLIEENKMGKYFKYAIGEILLVMIGILLALQVNNWNESRSNEERFVKILKEIRNDLETDIESSIPILQLGKEMDSLVNLVLEGNLKKEDYLKKENRKLFWVGLQFIPFDYQKTAFKKFENFNNVVPNKFDTIINSINNHYNTSGKLYDDIYKIFREQIKDRHDYLSNNTSWYHLLRRNQINDEMINFYLNNPTYKNWTSQHQVDNTASDEYGEINNLQISAFGLVSEISEVLDDLYKTKNPKILKKYGQPIFKEEPWTGVYENSKTGKYVIDKKSGYLYGNYLFLKRVSKDTLSFKFSPNWILVADKDNSNKIKGIWHINLKDSTQNRYSKRIEL